MRAGLLHGASRLPSVPQLRNEHGFEKNKAIKVSHKWIGRKIRHRNTQAYAALPHRPSTDLADPTASTAVAVSPASSSVLSYLGLGSPLNSEKPLLDECSPHHVPSIRGVPSAGATLLRALQRAGNHLGSSLEQFLLDSSAESMPNWDASTAASALMALGMLRRRPDDTWLRQYWAFSLAKLPGCTAADLAMLSFGLSELQLQPPTVWREGLLGMALRRAEETCFLTPGPLSRASQSTSLKAPPAPTSPASNSAGSSETEAGCSTLKPLAPSVGYGTTGQAAGAGVAAGGAVQRINSAYDMEDVFGRGEPGPASSSSIAGLVLGPAQALWDGMRAAAGTVSETWRRSRTGSDLVTLLYNVTAAELPLDAVWVERYVEALLPCLADMSGEDLHCLMEVTAEQHEKPQPGAVRPLRLSTGWQAAFFAGVDGINWALQGHHLVGILVAVSDLRLLAPSPWIRRQLLRLQPHLTDLPTAELVQLGALLPTLPGCMEAAGKLASRAPFASLAADISSPSAAAADSDAFWLERWLEEYRSAILERTDGVSAADLVVVIAGVTALTHMSHAPSPASTALEPDGSQIDGAAISSYSVWRRMMVAAVAARIPDCNLTALCETWQALADASAIGGAGPVGSGLEGGAAKTVGASASSALGSAAEDSDLAELREVISERLAAHPAHLSASDVAPVMSCLAAAGLPLPSPTLDTLLSAAQPHLATLTGAELVTLALCLVRLSYKPNLAWQAAFCAASRGRLATMTQSQRCTLLVAAANLGLHLPDPWVRDFFSLSERDGLEEPLDGLQLGNLLWAVSCVTAEPPASWMEAWEFASMSRLHELGPNMLAVVLKAMSTLDHRPSLPWQRTFFSALQRRLFSASSAQLSWDANCCPLSSGPSSSPSGSLAPAASDLHLSAPLTTQGLTSLVYSLASLDLAPPGPWLDELMDVVRCKLSLLSTLDCGVVLAYLVARRHRPADEWWDCFLDALEGRFTSLSATELAAQLVMLHALKVSPSAHWLDAFCSATQDRVGFFQPAHMLQVLSCLHLFRHRPGQAWMAAFTTAVHNQLPRFTPTELARVLMLLDHLNQRPSAGFMLRFYDFSRPGLAQLDAQELVNVAWAVVSCSTLQPDLRWMEALMEAARPRLASLQQPQLRVLVAALGHMQRGVPSETTDGFLAFAREFLVL